MLRTLIQLFVAAILSLSLSSCTEGGKTKVATVVSPHTTVTSTYSTPSPVYNSSPIRTNSSRETNPRHYDNQYKYEYRTGNTNDYQYNYDVNGSDPDGNSVYGNVDMDGKYGSGTIEDDDGNEIEVDVEWVDYGQMEMKTAILMI
jgi:hypothetical protein